MSTENKQEKNEDTYFNVTVHCVAYINEIKVKKAKKPDEKDEVRVSLAVLHGNSKKPKKEFYSVTADTDQVRDVLRPVFRDINDKDKRVLTTIIVSKGDSSAFVFEDGPKQGTMGVTHFGSVREIKRLKVDGEVVYSQNVNEAEGYQKQGSFN